MSGFEKLLGGPYTIPAFLPVAFAVGTYAHGMAYHGFTPAQANRASWMVFRISCAAVLVGWLSLFIHA